MFWTRVIVLIAAFIISALLAPKIKRKPEAFDDIDFPQWEEGTPQQVVFGDAWTESWMVLTVGKYHASKITKGNWFTGKQTVGYKYYFGIHAGLFRGPIDRIVTIKVDDKIAFTGSISGNATVTINKPDLFGGNDKEGGIVGPLQVLMGGPTQLATPELAAFFTSGGLGDGGTAFTPTSLIPGFRGVVTTYFDGQVSANSPYPKTWAYRCQRALMGWQDNAVWYSAKAVIPLDYTNPAGAVTVGEIKAMNPAHILYECLTNKAWGRGFDPNIKLDLASWTAAADLFYTEKFGLAFKWTRQDSIGNVMRSVIDTVGGAIYPDRTTGKLKLVAIRGDYVIDDLPLYTYDNGLLEVLDDDSSAQTVGVNEVICGWHDPVENKDGQARAQNLGAQANGKISKTVDYPGVATFQMAARLAKRDLRADSGFVKKFTLRMDRRAYEEAPATVFRFSDAARGIDAMVVRVGRIDEAETGDAAIKITVLEDIFGLQALTHIAEQPNPTVPPPITVPIPEAPQTWPSVISATTASPPGAPADGDAYLIPAGATGAWSGHTGQVAVWDAASGTWLFTTPTPGTVIYIRVPPGYVGIDASGNVVPAPWLSVLIGIPTVALVGNLTIDSTHNGKKLVNPVGAPARTVTFPAFASVPLTADHTTTIINESVNALTVVVTTDVLKQRGFGIVPSVVLTQHQATTVTHNSNTIWFAL